MGSPADVQTLGTTTDNLPTAGGIGVGGVPTASVVDTSSTTALATGTSVDMVLTYAGQQSSILEFQRSLYQLMRPYGKLFRKEEVRTGEREGREFLNVLRKRGGKGVRDGSGVFWGRK